MDDRYCIEWSKKQNALHLSKFNDVVINNKVNFFNHITTDWIIIYVGDEKSCQKMFSSITSIIDGRLKVKELQDEK